MGLLKNKFSKALRRQRKATLEEAEKARCTLKQEFEQVNDDAASVKGAVGGTLKAFTGGKMQVDSLQIYHWSHAITDFTYFQPFSGMMVLPGEHHAILPGSVRSPLIVKKGLLGGAKWVSPDDKELAAQCKDDKGLKKALKGLKWEWGIGASKIEHEWTIQVRATGDGRTHIVMQVGRYGGFTTYKVGYAKFLEICEAIKSSLQSEPHEEQNFIEEPCYMEAVEQLATEALNKS